MMKFIGVFLALFILDFVFARYTNAVTNNLALQASFLASLIILLNGAAAVGYVSEPWLLIPAMLGAFSGTWLSIKIHPNKNNT